MKVKDQEGTEPKTLYAKCMEHAARPCQINGYLFYYLTHFFLKKDYMILISFYHLLNESDPNHLNHSFTRTFDKNSICFVGMFVSECVCTHTSM